jgi:riboflavin kinase / FMN adenylyltransferase
VSFRRVDGASHLGAPPRSSLVAIGNFDGVHLGHRAVLTRATAEAAELGLTPVLLTFDPHPSRVLGRGALPVLTTLERKIELLQHYHGDLTVVVEPFTLELAQLEPRDFAEGLLAGMLGARVVIVGENFRFGRNRSGDLTTLVELGKTLGFAARPEELSGDASGPYSSTRVRTALSAGDLPKVERLLGRPHSLSGRVVAGAQRGRTIGVPTANLADVPEALPPYGVYAVLVDLVTASGPRVLGKGVANIGNRPTLDAGFSVEAHLFDLDQDLYGANLRVHLAARLREERRFEGLEALKAQIARDSEAARAALADRVPESPRGWY